MAFWPHGLRSGLGGGRGEWQQAILSLPHVTRVGSVVHPGALTDAQDECITPARPLKNQQADLYKNQTESSRSPHMGGKGGVDPGGSVFPVIRGHRAGRDAPLPPEHAQDNAVGLPHPEEKTPELPSLRPEPDWQTGRQGWAFASNIQTSAEDQCHGEGAPNTTHEK